MLSAVTGWDVSAAELLRAGERVVAAKKLYNSREGWTRDEDTLPERFLTESSGGDPRFALSRAGLDRMIASYYAAQGWTPSGDVPAERVCDLGLQDLFPEPAR